jgi:hypothetical protein
VAYKDPSDPRLLEARLRWYAANKQRQIDRQSERKQEAITWVRSLKTACQRCGFANPVALQFHHLNPDEKDIAISTAINKGWGRARISEEIEKCEVICANCHAVEHIMG